MNNSYIIGSKSEYDESIHSELIYICNDTNDIYYPQVLNKETLDNILNDLKELNKSNNSLKDNIEELEKKVKELEDRDVKDTKWLDCPFNQSEAGSGRGRANARQIGNLVTIMGFLVYGDLRDGSLAFTIPKEIDTPHVNIDLDFHQKGSAERNRGCTLRLTRTNKIIIAEQYSYSGDTIYFNFTYLT